MAREGRGRADRLGILAAAWIGGLGGLFVGAVCSGGMTLITVGFLGFGQPEGYYADGIVYGFVGGAFLGSLVGLAAGAALARRFGNRLVALVGGVLGIVGGAVYGLFAHGLAVDLESAFLSNAVGGGLLAATAFAAAGGVLAVALRSAPPGTGRGAALRDLIAGGILGSFLGMLGGGFTQLAIAAWAVPASSPNMHEGVLFGFYLGAAVGAAVATVVGVIVRRIPPRAAAQPTRPTSFKVRPSSAEKRV